MHLFKKLTVAGIFLLSSSLFADIPYMPPAHERACFDKRAGDACTIKNTVAEEGVCQLKDGLLRCTVLTNPLLNHVAPKNEEHTHGEAVAVKHPGDHDHDHGDGDVPIPEGCSSVPTSGVISLLGFLLGVGIMRRKRKE